MPEPVSMGAAAIAGGTALLGSLMGIQAQKEAAKKQAEMQAFAQQQQAEQNMAQGQQNALGQLLQAYRGAMTGG